MRIIVFFLTVCLLFNGAGVRAQQWRPADSSGVWEMDSSFVSAIFSGKDVVNLPVNGRLVSSQFIENRLLPPALSIKYGIRTFDIRFDADKEWTGKCTFVAGLAYVTLFKGTKVEVLEPVSGNMYRSKIRAAGTVEHEMRCLTEPSVGAASALKSTATATGIKSGDSLITYRLALSCNHYYARAATGKRNPTKAEALAKMTVSVNRINGVYEREVGVSLQFVANEDTLIFCDSSADPLGPANSSPGFLVGLNQRLVDSLIGPANYDIGHVFTTGGGGLSQVGCVCVNGTKAQSVTGSANPVGDGFDIDYVVHEIGHQFGANHTFNNNNNGQCTGNASPGTAVEPGSGSTIMAYAGICAPDNIQQHSDDYFSAASLVEMNRFIRTTPRTCGTRVTTGNKAPVVDAFNATYTIPILTPFMLDAPPATDSAPGSTLDYCWEQWNFGAFGLAFFRPYNEGPTFRSYQPTAARTRVFPRMPLVMQGKTADTARNNAQGEKLPYDSRFLTFRLTVRSLLNGKGAYIFPDDSIHLDVINTGQPFIVTSQAESDMAFLSNSVLEVRWNNVGTSTAPFNAAEVDIYLATDSGTNLRFLGRFPNSGTASVTLPATDTTITKARFLVKAHNNVFFNVNSKDFTIISATGGPLTIFPNPAHNSLNILTGREGAAHGVARAADGRLVWIGMVDGLGSIDVNAWARGVYFFTFSTATGKLETRKVVIY